MDHFRFIVCMYFQKVSSYNILHGDLDYRKFKKDDFDALCLREFPDLTETETDALYFWLDSEIGEGGTETGLNVFRALKESTGDYLLIRENKPICRYDQLLQWREMTRSIGEDLPICAFLAARTERSGYVWKDFEWGTVIGHDNMQLNRLMQRGISDNHFHLFASAPSFKLIWIKLMNQLVNNQYLAGLREIDRKKRQTRNKYSLGYREDLLEKMLFQAALIRAVLFYYITASRNNLQEAIAEVLKNKDRIQGILTGDAEPAFYCQELQCRIDSMRMMFALPRRDVGEDYANLAYEGKSINHEFEGERALLYQMLLGYVGNRPIPEFLMNWFYAYLTIQIKLREELVQVNDTIGFSNFSQYNRRKGDFLFSARDNRRMVQHAVMGSLETGNLRSLEMRIAPEKTAKENARCIKLCDAYLGEYLSEEQMKNIYYVFHFPKKKDERPRSTNGFLSTCRHETFRRELERRANELIRFREEYPREAARVLGIDACAQEIGCRPEVFASVFRQLTQHVASEPLFDKVQQWKITYHVGEDWMDMADGLRAIDEAVLFLNMKNGDRLGHATVLGLNVRKWYQKKRCSICLSEQDYLDNVVWMYHKLLEFDIQSCETLKGYLQGEYEKYFKRIYKNYIDEDLADCNINTYYEAWKLRGDHPDLYKRGKFENPYNFFCEHWVNEAIWGGKEIRNEQEKALLLFYYHYSAEVRNQGERVKSIRIPDVYIDGVERVQRAMQRWIAAQGICVETNPSSNYMISTMEAYEEHPISNLFNMGLTLKAEEIAACAQIHVSINTDDKGIFGTSLENEYALMGCAMEHTMDSQGNNRYQKQMVYDWLEHIRKNGNQQSFLNHSVEIERQ